MFYRIFLLCLGMMVSLAGVAAQEKTFDIMEYQVEGNKVLSVSGIEKAVYPFLGEKKSIAEVEKARVALENAYHDAGYLTVLVDIPEQTVESGVVRLKVTEGAIGRVRVVGSHYYSQSKILAQVPELAPGTVPYFPAMQKQLEGLNRQADRQVMPVMKSGKTQGSIDAELKVADKLPFHASLELNNYNSVNTDPLRLSGMMRYDNLWQLGHSASISYQTSPQATSQVKVLSGTYLMPLSGGDQLALYAVNSHSNVASNVAAIGDSTMLGQGYIYGARWIKPLPSRGQYFHSLTLGVDYKDFSSVQKYGGTSLAPSGGTTPIAYMPFSVAYSATLANLLNAENSINGNIALNFNLRGLADKTILCTTVNPLTGSVSSQIIDQFECSRFNAKPDYFYLKGGLDTTQQLFDMVSIYARIDGQIAGGSLIPNEQFTAGGQNSVRGYHEAEAAGDDGIHGTMELRGPKWRAAGVDNLMLIGFIDAAHLRVRDPLPLQQANFNLESIGLGLRFSAYKNYSMMLDLARPLKTDGIYTQAGNWHMGFKSILAF